MDIVSKLIRSLGGDGASCFFLSSPVSENTFAEMFDTKIGGIII